MRRASHGDASRGRAGQGAPSAADSPACGFAVSDSPEDYGISVRIGLRPKTR